MTIIVLFVIFNVMKIILWIVIAIFVIGVAALAHAAYNTEDGYEDENGFELGKDDDQFDK